MNGNGQSSGDGAKRPRRPPRRPTKKARALLARMRRLYAAGGLDPAAAVAAEIALYFHPLARREKPCRAVRQPPK